MAHSPSLNATGPLSSRPLLYVRWCLVAMALATAAILLPTPLPAQGTPPSLPYSRGFLVTGDYVVGGIDLREATNPIVSGFSTAPISDERRA